MDGYLDSIRGDAAGFATVIREHDITAPVPSCPGWDLRALAEHLGWVHRWARLAAVTAAPPDESLIDPAPQDADALADWILAGASDLVAALEPVPEDAPTWHPFPVARRAGVWPRRQAHELAIHRWDAEASVGEPSGIDPARAADFVGEYLEVVVPRVVDRDGRRAPQGDLLITLTDTGDRFGVRVDGPVVHVVPPSVLVQPAEITGNAQDVLLALWRRQSLSDAPDDERARAWLAFGGN